jgi:N-acetyl-gamma-glutamyl-phosphate reductase
VAIPVAILGASGYAGAGLISRLLRHPETEVVALGSRGSAGRPLADIWPQFAGLDGLAFCSNDEAIDRAEVVFCATPHAATAPLVKCALDRDRRVIDLSADFRLPPDTYAGWYGQHPHPELYPRARYGLVELHRDELEGAELVASPGCNATTASLALAPLAAEGLLGPEVSIALLTGASGAGRGTAEGLHYSELNENIRPYKVAGGHRHLAEIELTLGRAAAFGKRLETHAEVATPTVTFTPHLVPTTRGILASCVTTPERASSDSELLELYRTYYADDPMIWVQEELPQTKAVTGSDRTLIAVRRDVRSGAVVAMAATDNLGKGAAGQAVQGFNIAFGFDERSGLEMRGEWP